LPSSGKLLSSTLLVLRVSWANDHCATIPLDNAASITHLFN